MDLFYGKAACVSCHSGSFQTDQEFHAVAIPQIGPGKGDGSDGHDDFGRERVTGDMADRYAFRTPPLRNVVLTGPWGHDGAFNDLEAMVRHHLDPFTSLRTYDKTQVVMPSRPDLDALDFIAYDDPVRLAALEDECELLPIPTSDEEIADLMEFLHALTDPSSLDLRSDVPRAVPSGLPLAE